MKAYINGAASISAQLNDSTPATEAPLFDHLKCIEPDYKNFIQPALLRRMSRILKMGVASAQMALNDAGIEKPDAILTGTGLGCIEDTEKFLSAIILNNEQYLTPTSFIQSTHNTVGGQIALMLKCNVYNFTYVHRAFSFESCLLDALMILEEKKSAQVLLGATDELTENSLQLMRRLQLLHQPQSDAKTKGSIAGEGAQFFVLANQKNEKSYAEILACKLIYKPQSKQEVRTAIKKLLEENQLTEQDIDLLVHGANGDVRFDDAYMNLLHSDGGIAQYKHLCGEYHTANAFGFYSAARILKEQKVPASMLKKAAPSPIKHLLLYNAYQGIHHSLILLRAC